MIAPEPIPTKKPERWSLFMLAYNEEACLDTALERTMRALKEITPDWDLLVIDDGSRDRTGEIADRWAAREPRVRVWHNPANLGISANLVRGFRQVQGDVGGMVSSDMQFDPLELTALARGLIGADVVNAYRLERHDSLRRKLITGCERLVNRALFGLALRDYHWINMYRKWVLDACRIEASSLFVETEVLIQAQAMGARIVQVPTTHRPRTSGQSHGGSNRNVFDAVRDTLRFRIKLWREPLRVTRPPAS